MSHNTVACRVGTVDWGSLEGEFDAFSLQMPLESSDGHQLVQCQTPTVSYLTLGQPPPPPTLGPSKGSTIIRLPTF
jgi:hypothetical protein